MGGAFQTSREIFDNPIWKNIVEFRLFFLIYGNAVFSDEGVRLAGDLILQRGEWCRSTRKIQDDLTYIENRQVKTYSTSVIHRAIVSLVKAQRLCTRKHELGTVFTVVNYEQYQGFHNYKKDNLEHNLEQSGNSGRTVEEQSGNNNKKVNNDNKDKKENKHKELIVEIVNYLNAATGKSYSSDTKETIKLISGRITDGRTIEQFRHVIDVKTEEWLGDEKMERCLKPNTLFAQSNFESYVNQKRVIRGGGNGAKPQGVSQGFRHGSHQKKSSIDETEWKSLVFGSPTVRV